MANKEKDMLRTSERGGKIGNSRVCFCERVTCDLIKKEIKRVDRERMSGKWERVQREGEKMGKGKIEGEEIHKVGRSKEERKGLVN